MADAIGEPQGSSEGEQQSKAALFSAATERARLGKYQEARSLLAELPAPEQSSSHVLDLLARISAQNGELNEAERLWEQVPRTDSLHLAAQAGLRRIAAIRRARAGRPPVWQQLVGLLLLATSAVGWLSARESQARSEASYSAHQATLESQILALESEMGDLRDTSQPRLETLEALSARNAHALSELRETSESTASVALGPAVPMEALDFQGVDLEEVASVVVVRFTEGLFLDDTALHPWAVAVLTELGSRLLPYEDDISITVIGYVDDGERDSEAERDSLRIRRAAEVVRFLVEAAELPAGLFSIGYPGSSTPLVPNETWPDRSRNRTACLIISARTGFRGTP